MPVEVSKSHHVSLQRLFLPYDRASRMLRSRPTATEGRHDAGVRMAFCQMSLRSQRRGSTATTTVWATRSLTSCVPCTTLCNQAFPAFGFCSSKSTPSGCEDVLCSKGVFSETARISLRTEDLRRRLSTRTVSLSSSSSSEAAAEPPVDDSGGDFLSRFAITEGPSSSIGSSPRGSGEGGSETSRMASVVVLSSPSPSGAKTSCTDGLDLCRKDEPRRSC